MIILLKTLEKHIVHRLFRYTADVRSVFALPADTLPPLADSSVDNTLLQTAPNVNQSLQRCGPASHTHTAA